MNSSIIDHKLRVFISSKCGGKYSIARKSLKILLEATGLLEVYVFETEPASSEDTISSYLESVDESNLCVFLIDNEDGVPAAVLSEEKRAKDKQLRLIYLFCDENKKEPTPMQEEIKVSLSQKYYVVNQFSDIVPKAYESVLQDLIAVYKHKKTFVSDEESAEGSNSKAVTDSEIYALSPSCYSQYPKACSVFTRVFSSEDSVIEETSSMDNLLSEHLKSVIGLST